MTKYLYEKFYRDTAGPDHTGKNIPRELKMVDFETKREISVLDFCKNSGMPVVFNIGSCT